MFTFSTVFIFNLDGTHDREYLGTALYDTKDLQKVYFKIFTGRSPDNLFR